MHSGRYELLLIAILPLPFPLKANAITSLPICVHIHSGGDSIYSVWYELLLRHPPNPHLGKMGETAAHLYALILAVTV